MPELSYPKAVGYLQSACTGAAIEIEALLRNGGSNDWAEPLLQQIAARLRQADFVATALVDPDSTTSSQIERQGDR